METSSLVDMLKLIWPIIVLQIGFQIYAIVDLFKHPNVKNLNKWIWLVIIIFGEIFGPILYFTLGRNLENE